MAIISYLFSIYSSSIYNFIYVLLPAFINKKKTRMMCVCVFLNKPEEILTLRAVVSPDRTLRYVSLPA